MNVIKKYILFCVIAPILLLYPLFASQKKSTSVDICPQCNIKNKTNTPSSLFPNDNTFISILEPKKSPVPQSSITPTNLPSSWKIEIDSYWENLKFESHSQNWGNQLDLFYNSVSLHAYIHCNSHPPLPSYCKGKTTTERNRLFFNRKDHEIYDEINNSSIISKTGYSGGEFAILRTFQNALSSKNSEEFLNSLKKNSASLNSDQKDRLLMLIGSKLNGVYNENRRDYFSTAARGSVTEDQIFKTLKQNPIANSKKELILMTTDPSNQIDASAVSGVCRDLSLLQAKAAKALGYKNVALVAFSTHGSAHVNMIAQNADNKRSLSFKVFDQDYLVEINQWKNTYPSDISIQHYFFEPDKGKFTYVQATQFFEIIQQGLGSQNKVTSKFQENFYKQINIAKASHSFGAFDLSLYAGSDLSQSKYMGVGLLKNYPEEKDKYLNLEFNSKWGISAGNRIFQTYPEDLIRYQSNTHFLYTEFENKVNFPSITFNQSSLDTRLYTQVFGNTTLTQASGYQSSPFEPMFDPGLSIRGEASLVSDWLDPERPDKFLSTLFAGIELRPSLKDIRNVDIPSGLTIALNEIKSEAELKYQFSKSTLHWIKLKAVLKCLHFGCQGKLAFIHEYEKMILEVGVSGRINEEMPSFISQSERQLILHFSKNIEQMPNTLISLYALLALEPTASNAVKANLKYSF